jgi:hypothetical protein
LIEISVSEEVDVGQAAEVGQDRVGGSIGIDIDGDDLGRRGAA